MCKVIAFANQKGVEVKQISSRLDNVEKVMGIAPEKADKNFSVLKKYKMPVEEGIVIDCCDRMRPINENAWYFPAFLV